MIREKEITEEVRIKKVIRVIDEGVNLGERVNWAELNALVEEAEHIYLSVWLGAGRYSTGGNSDVFDLKVEKEVAKEVLKDVEERATAEHAEERIDQFEVDWDPETKVLYM